MDSEPCYQVKSLLLVPWACCGAVRRLMAVYWLSSFSISLYFLADGTFSFSVLDYGCGKTIWWSACEHSWHVLWTFLEKPGYLVTNLKYPQCWILAIVHSLLWRATLLTYSLKTTIREASTHLQHFFSTAFTPCAQNKNLWVLHAAYEWHTNLGAKEMVDIVEVMALLSA